MISVGSQLNPSMYEHCTVYEITSGCVYERWGSEYFVGTWCMHIKATSLTVINTYI